MILWALQQLSFIQSKHNFFKEIYQRKGKHQETDHCKDFLKKFLTL